MLLRIRQLIPSPVQRLEVVKDILEFSTKKIVHFTCRSARTRNTNHNNAVGDEDDEKEICRPISN